MNKEQKLIFLFLITCQQTTESGIYPITIKSISDETGISIPIVNKCLSVGIPNIMYDHEKEVVFIVNFLRYNGRGRNDIIRRSIELDFGRCKTGLWKAFQETYPVHAEFLENISITNPISIPISIPIPIQDLGKSYQDLDESNNINKLIYDYYLGKIQPEQCSKQRSLQNIAYHLGTYSKQDLEIAINNYNFVSTGREPKYRKDPANFFNKRKPFFFFDYLKENYIPQNSSGGKRLGKILV